MLRRHLGHHIGGQTQRLQLLGQPQFEHPSHHDAEGGNRQQAGRACHRIVAPDAVPARSAPTAFITVVVSGATVTAMPRPSTQTAGRKPLQ